MHILIALAAAAAAAAPPPPVTLQQLDVPQDKGEQQVVVQTRVFGPDVGAGWHIHHGVEVVYIASGEVTFWVGNQSPRRIKAGESVSIPRGTVHRARGAGKVPARLVITLMVDKGPPLREDAAPPAS